MAKVLLVEDDNNLREIYEARLTAEGYEIITAQNGEEALSAAKQNKPDLIVSDVMMPRISGFEMLDILRNTDELKNTKVIMLTALGQAEDRNRADNLGADKYLVKSQVTLEDIVNAAKELLSNEPIQTPMPSVPQVSVPAPEPVIAAQTPVQVAAMPDEPAAQTTVAPVVMPDPVTVTPVEPVIPAPATPAPVASAPIAPPPTDPAVGQSDIPVTPEQIYVPTPAPTPADTTVTVTDPDPITQRVSPPAEPLIPEETVDSVQTLTPEPVVEVEAPAPLELPETPPPMTAEPQSLAAEEAAIQAQIDSFAASDQPPAPEVIPAPTANDAILDDAINKLTATPGVTVPTVEQPITAPALAPSAEVPQDPVEPPSPTVDTTSQITGRKVIQPLSDSEAGTTNINELLAQEEAKEAAQNQPSPQAPSQVVPENPPRPGFDPNSIAL